MSNFSRYITSSEEQFSGSLAKQDLLALDYLEKG